MIFAGNVALVTGAASGIGLATAHRFAELGARVVLSDITVEQGEAAAEELRANGHEARFVQADVGDNASVEALFAGIKQNEGRLDFAFNNAGIEGTRGAVDVAEPGNWERVIGVNLSSVYYCMRQELPLMREAGGGVIVNNASVAGLVGIAGSPAYCASKHGVIGITRSTAVDVAKERIRVNAICPGIVDTAMVQRAYEADPSVRTMLENMQPIGRMGEANEIAAAVMWLCQPEAAFVTGIALPLDGAWTAH